MLDENIQQICLRVNGILPFNMNTETFAEERIYPKRNSEKKYRVSCGVIAFVTEDRDYYVSPFADTVKSYLIRNKYEQGKIDVPFINGDTPSDKHSLKTWADLCDFALILYREKNSSKTKSR